MWNHCVRQNASGSKKESVLFSFGLENSKFVVAWRKMGGTFETNDNHPIRLPNEINAKHEHKSICCNEVNSSKEVD